MKISSQKLQQFQKTIYHYYQKNRRDLPWRNTRNPYHILVSEVMLQQTQVARVLKKYPEFLMAFPTIESLAMSSIKDVLKVWQGMGYNRRALYLQSAAKIIVEKYKGIIPQDRKVFETLPGIGKGTSGSIAAFAYNKPAIFIETNIRRVYIHFFFQNKENISDKEILPLVEKTIDAKNPREWYYALMDYGAMLAKTVKNPNRKSKHYVKQSRFTGSDRQIRGVIVKYLLNKNETEEKLRKIAGLERKRFKKILSDLKSEGFLLEQKGALRLFK